MIKYLKKYIKKILLYVLPLISKEKYSRSIIFLSHPDLCDNSFALFQYLYDRLDDSWTFYWVVKDKEAAATIMKRDCKRCQLGRVHLLELGKSSTWFHTKFSAYQFDTHGAEYEKNRFMKTVFVSLWHGSPLKEIGNAVVSGAVSQHPDFLCSGHQIFNRFLSHGLNMPMDSIILTGYPRNDWLTGKLDSTCTIDISESFVVWMPTYTSSSGTVYSNTYKGKDSSLSQESLGCMTFSDLARLDEHLSSIKLKLVIKLHSHDDRNINKFCDVVNILIIRGNDSRVLGSGLYGLLYQSSALISDCSSVIFDYALTEKPIAIDMTALQHYTRPLNFPFPDDDLYQVHNFDDVCSFLDEVKCGARPSTLTRDKYNVAIKDSFSEKVAATVGLLPSAGVTNITL